MTGHDKRPFGEDELRARLSDEQFQVTQNKGTERAFTGRYLHHKDQGVYTCAVCDAGDRIGDARPRGDETNADLVGRPRIRIRCVHSGLLMTNQDVLELFLLKMAS